MADDGLSRLTTPASPGLERLDAVRGAIRARAAGLSLVLRRFLLGL
jgi:hypothetical protein